MTAGRRGIQRPDVAPGGTANHSTSQLTVGASSWRPGRALCCIETPPGDLGAELLSPIEVGRLGVREREPVFGQHDPARRPALRRAALVRAMHARARAVAAAVAWTTVPQGALPPATITEAGPGLPSS